MCLILRKKIKITKSNRHLIISLLNHMGFKAKYLLKMIATSKLTMDMKLVYIYMNIPETVSECWINSIIDFENIITSIDIVTFDTAEAQRAVGKSINEQNSRFSSAKKEEERIRALNKKANLEKIYENLLQGADSLKSFYIKIYVKDETLSKLNTKISTITGKLKGKGFKTVIAPNEQFFEWQSLYLPARIYNQGLYKREGKTAFTETIAGGNPFNFADFKDPKGTYYGLTFAGRRGVVLLDVFNASEKRTSYNHVIVGKSGSGKSTFLKKMLIDRAMRGDSVWIFDVMGEFTEIINDLNGKTIDVNGSNANRINTLEIFKTSENIETVLAQHFSKIEIIYSLLVPDSTIFEKNLLTDTIKDVYKAKGIFKEGDLLEFTKPLSEFKSSDFPIFSDVVNVINERIEENKEKKYMYDTVKTYKKIQMGLRTLTEEYGSIFNRFTSIENLDNEKILSFNLNEIKEMKDEIVSEVLFNFLLLSWSKINVKGNKMKKLYEKGNIDEDNIEHSLLVIDEAHRIINSKRAKEVELLLQFVREGRKLFAGLALASQGILDFVPENADTESLSKMKTLFEQSQYKWIFNQDNNARKRLYEIFGESLSESDIANIPKQKKGEVTFVMGEETIRFKVDLSSEELIECSKGGGK